jgi:hypothetical protein
MRWLGTVGRGWRHRAGVNTAPDEGGLRTAEEGNADTRASPHVQGTVLEHPSPAFVREEIYYVRECKHGHLDEAGDRDPLQ